VSGAPGFTAEQAAAIERRDGPVVLSAAAGSGKTTVLVERFVRLVIEDGIELPRILAVTFTEKAAAEMRRRVRAGFAAHGRPDLAREAERAAISTIHGFCARVLREHAVEAGLDPGFSVLDDPTSRELLAGAYDEALAAFMAGDAPEALAFVAVHRGDTLQAMITEAHGSLRAAGRPVALPRRERGPYPRARRAALRDACGPARAEIAAGKDGKRRDAALAAIERCAALLDRLGPDEDLDAALLGALTFKPTAAALKGPAADAYREAHAALHAACRDREAAADLLLADELLRAFDAAYERAKRERAALDFTDLELRTRDLLASSEGVRALVAGRFDRVMVDEFQDTNHLQLALLDLLGAGQRFVVGDDRQSIYRFRHADVEIFRAQRGALEGAGGALRLTENFRSRPEIVAAVNAVLLDRAPGETPMTAARAPAGEPRVELIVADEGAAWEADPLLPGAGGKAFHKQAEARAVAARIAELVRRGPYDAGDVVVLLRATGDMALYQRAIERHGLATLAPGARGFWSDPHVGELCAYLAALVNPVDEAALLTVMASPLGAFASADALALLGLARERPAQPLWERLCAGDVEEWGAALAPPERARIAAFARRFSDERARAPRIALDALLERAVAHAGYDEIVLRMPGGEQRLANVNKLIDLAAAYEARHGRDARAFADRVLGEIDADAPESEAPVELAGVDAVRLMTIHAAKGLQFPVVVVADLGRPARGGAPALLVDGDRVGIRVPRMHDESVAAFDHDELAARAREAAEREEERLLHVAMTRAEEHLVLAGSCKVDPWPDEGSRPITWLRAGLQRAGVAPVIVTPESERELFAPAPGPGGVREVAPEELAAPAPPAPPRAPAGPPVATVSYSSLTRYAECSYRFYLERVLGLPPKEAPAPEPGGEQQLALAVAGLDPLQRGSLAHELLETIPLDALRAPAPEEVLALAARRELEPTPAEVEDLRALVDAALAGATMARVRAARSVHREQPFALALPGPGAPLVNGIVDLLAIEDDGGALVVDYKTDHIGDADPEAVVASGYAIQRTIYALAALRSGAPRVEVVHLFLERPAEPAVARYDRADAGALEAQVAARAAGLVERRFPVAETPHRELCATCPGRGGLCSWPEERVLRPLADAGAPR
jgi:ATP-dependent exoDNAse (exonuclease V) beta subunit